MILLVWLWLTNVVLLFGAELNAVIDLRRSPHLLEALRRAAAAGQGAGGRLARSCVGSSLTGRYGERERRPSVRSP